MPVTNCATGSEHGWLGAVAAPAQHLAARDAWVGQGDAGAASAPCSRPEPLPPPCQNLASTALGLCLGRVGRDFEERYGYRPLLVETFVDLSPHDGASLRAAIWQLVGKSAGRGAGRREVDLHVRAGPEVAAVARRAVAG